MPPTNRENTGAVFITGASTGIGAACALHLESLGHRVYAGVRRDEDGEALRERGTGLITPVILDVTKPDQIDAAAELVTAMTGVGGLGGLVNNAGIAITGPLEFIGVERLRRQLEVNVVGQIAVTQAFLPLIRRGTGRIVNMSSVSGIYTLPFFGPYAASKHALEAATDALRQELAPWEIHVAAIEPGIIETPIWGKGFSELDNVEAELPEHGRRLYAPFLSPARDVVAERSRHGAPPEAVARAVAHAIRSPKPKTRYLVGSDAKLGARLMRLLPDRWRDAAARRLLRMPSQPPR